jgi:hypothetical protein
MQLISHLHEVPPLPHTNLWHAQEQKCALLVHTEVLGDAPLRFNRDVIIEVLSLLTKESSDPRL